MLPRSPNTLPLSVCKMSLSLSRIVADFFGEEKKTRDKAVKNLAAFLSEAPEDALSKSEMDKLWKGIFYCVSR